jgi:AcrR family transcriptional regulator
MTAPGLRERKKLATRDALSQAAIRLLTEQGLDAVTPEAVAEAAGVSARTFRNYFASREEAIVDAFVQRCQSMISALRARPADESAWESLTAVLPTAFPDVVGSRAGMTALKCAAQDDPAMFAQHVAAFERIHHQMVEAIAARSGTDANRDLAPRLLAAAAGAALRTSMELWSDGDTETSLPDLVRESLAQLQAGLPVGHATKPTT